MTFFGAGIILLVFANSCKNLSTSKTELKKERLVWSYLDANNLEGTFSKIKGNQWREVNSNKDGAVFIFQELETNEEYILLSDDNRVDNSTVYIKLYQDSCLYRTNKSNWVLLYKGSWK